MNSLHVSTLRNTIEVLFELLELKAEPNNQNSKGSSALWIAAQKNHSACAQLLIDYGADVNLANKTGATPTYVKQMIGIDLF